MVEASRSGGSTVAGLPGTRSAKPEWLPGTKTWGFFGPERVGGVGRFGQPEPAGARRRPRRGRDRAGVLVQLRLDVICGGAAHVEIGRVIGVADPAEVIRVGLAGGRIGGLKRGEQRVRGGRRVVAVVDEAASWATTLDPEVEQLVHAEVVGLGPLGGVGDVGGLHPQRVGVGVVDGVVGGVPRVVGGERVVDVHLDVVAIEPEVHAAGHPVDEPGTEQQPLGVSGAVVEADRELLQPACGSRGRWRRGAGRRP